MNSDRQHGRTTQTVGDTTQHTLDGLPDELKHDRIYGYRDTGGPLGEAYQIIFKQSWMPFDYKIPDGWRLQYARTEWIPHHSLPWILRRFMRGKARVVIVVSERELNHGF